MSLLAMAHAQNNPVPQIVGPVHPDAVAPGSGAFTLSVYGANFVPGSVVNWNYQPRTTTYISGHEIQAQILASDVETNTAGYITVTNPPPGGGSSSASWAQVEVHEPISTIAIDAGVYYEFGYWELEAADFNHDAILDLLGESLKGLALELGQGNGTFRPAPFMDATNLDTTPVTYGDFTGDGDLDVVSFLNGDLLNGTWPTSLNIELGNGQGSFTTGPTLESAENGGDFGIQVLAGDFNQDGKLDLITEGPGARSTYLGNGDGTFNAFAQYIYPGNGYYTGLVAGDFNGDGKLDLMILQANASQNLTIWFVVGNGDGTFKTEKAVGFVPNPATCVYGTPLQLSDFNGDGKLDLAFCTDRAIGVMLGNGDGTFQAPTFYTTDPLGTRQFTFAVGDINSDGKPDLIVSEYAGKSQFVVFLGNGDGTFQAPQTVDSNIPDGETGIVVGDFDSTGMLGTIFQNDLGMHVYSQK